MKSRKLLVTLAIIGIIAITSVMLTATYAYFAAIITGEGSKINVEMFNGDMEVTFTDTNNITLTNAYTGDSISKQFTVENTGDAPVFYNILLTNLTNNFAEPDELVYELTSTNGGANRVETIVPTTNNSKIASHIKIEPNVVQEYTLTVKFLKTQFDQTVNMNKTFSTEISIEGQQNKSMLSSMFVENTLGYEILSKNTVVSDTQIDYLEEPVSGLYYTNNSIDGTTVYFYRGGFLDLDNYVYFAGMCWRILRTTEDGGIRLVYLTDSSDGTCEFNNSFSELPTTKYNVNSNYNAYVGLKYGTPNSNSYEEEHRNTNNSLLLDALILWYNTRLNDYNDYIADSYYCNNRKVIRYVEDGIDYQKLGYSNFNTVYESLYKIEVGSETGNLSLSFDCYNQNDIFTISNPRGNASLGQKAIATLTIEELIMSGLVPGGQNSVYYLAYDQQYWLMTPAIFSDGIALMAAFTGNNINFGPTNYPLGVRPVITLKGDTPFLSGDGSDTTPYMITEVPEE